MMVLFLVSLVGYNQKRAQRNERGKETGSVGVEPAPSSRNDAGDPDMRLIP